MEPTPLDVPTSTTSATLTTSSTTSSPFLVHEASADTAQQLSRGGSAAVARPEVEQARSSNLQAGVKLSAEQPSSKVRKKMARQASSEGEGSQDSGGGFNDLLSGLLNVVGEGTVSEEFQVLKLRQCNL